MACRRARGARPDAAQRRQPARILWLVPIPIAALGASMIWLWQRDKVPGWLPVIATAVEGSREIIESDESGLLVPAGNSSDLATAVLRVLNDPHFASRLAAHAQDIVGESFTIIAATAAYDHLYRQLISTR